MIQRQLLANSGSRGNVILFLDLCSLLLMEEIVLYNEMAARKKEVGWIFSFCFCPLTRGYQEVNDPGWRETQLLLRGIEIKAFCFKFKDNFSIVKWIY